MLNINVTNGMVNIESPSLSYGNIKGMYKAPNNESRNGAGMQLNAELESKRDDIGEVCDLIANNVYRLQALLDDSS